jgi:hypothetical protein
LLKYCCLLCAHGICIPNIPNNKDLFCIPARLRCGRVERHIVVAADTSQARILINGVTILPDISTNGDIPLCRHIVMVDERHEARANSRWRSRRRCAASTGEVPSSPASLALACVHTCAAEMWHDLRESGSYVVASGCRVASILRVCCMGCHEVRSSFTGAGGDARRVLTDGRRGVSGGDRAGAGVQAGGAGCAGVYSIDELLRPTHPK